MVMLFSLTGCGFDPIYRAKSDQPQSLPFSLQVTGNNDTAYSTYKFKQEMNSLLSTLAPPPGGKLKVKIHLTEAFGDIGYGTDASILRSQGRMVATLTIHSNNGILLHENTLDTVSSYTINNAEEFTNLNARNAARERIIISLANEVSREISFVIRKLEASSTTNILSTQKTEAS